ncbi:MAG: hypothetical protein ABIZ81_18230, partial [Opitutaceae bacterium]
MTSSSPLAARRFSFLRTLALAGVFAAGASLLHSQEPGASSEPVVMLPPMTVTDQGAPLKWRYLEMPGLEILSVCDDSTGIAFAQRLRRLDDVLRVILPPRFIVRTAVSETMILLDEKTGQARSREVLADMSKNGKTRVRFLPNLRLIDLDATGVFAIVQPNSSTSFTYAKDRIAFLLERRVPRLPGWFVEGLLGFYEQLELTDRNVDIRPAVWISGEESMALRNDSERPRTLLPLPEFFARQRTKVEKPTELDRVWRAQCALFVRWATVENKGSNKEALWKFVDRLEQEAPTEALFRECFGIGYSDMRDQLSDYLSTATEERTALAAPPTPRQRLRFRAATDLEVARIRGEWERMEIAYVRARTPMYVDKYIEQARRTLGKAYERGEKDPRLLASLGLTEVDSGNPGSARLFLEAAVQAKVVRPRAYYELARLRYEAIVTEIGPEKRLTERQTTEVMAPLLAARRQQPPLPQIYALMANTLARSEAPPTAEQLATLHDSARSFPWITELMLRTIVFHVAGGQPAAAANLVDLALPHTTDPETRAKLERARAGLAGIN